MNYLAHSALADYSDDILLGSLLGDSWRGLPTSIEEPSIRAGLMLHRGLDRFTDGHPLFRRSRARLRPRFRRYAGILVDVFYDYILAGQWRVFRADPARRFADRVYRLSEEHHQWLPPKLKRFCGYMRDNDLLVRYQERATIGRVLEGLSTRLSRPNPLAEGLAELEREEAGFRADFFGFFPQAMHASRRLLAAIEIEIQSVASVQPSANNQPVQA